MVVPIKSNSFVSCKAFKNRSGGMEKEKKNNEKGRNINDRTCVIRSKVKCQRIGKQYNIIP